MSWILGQPPPPLTQTQLRTLLAQLAGFTPVGTFRNPYTYLIDFDGVDYYAINAAQTVYGGPDDAGGVDGASAIAVINAAIADSGSILLKADTTFPLTAKLALSETNNYVSIKGMGKSSVLQLACNDDLIYILGSEPPGTAVHFTISDLTLDGNKAAYPTGKNGLYVKHSMYNIFQNLWIKNFVEDGIHFENAQRSIFNNIFIEECDGEGFSMLNVGGETLLSNIWIVNSGNNGLLLNSVNYVQGTNIHSIGNGLNGVKFTPTGEYVCAFNTLTNCHSLNNIDAGFHLDETIDTQLLNCIAYDDQPDGSTTQITGFIIDQGYGASLVNCVSRRNLDYGVQVIGGGTDWFKLIGCTIEINKKHGVIVTDALHGLIIGCVIQGNDVDNTASYDGINLSNCSYLLINSNRIMDNDRYEINISADTSACLIIGNNLIHFDSEGFINNLSPDCTVKFNLGYATEDRGVETGNGAQQTIAHCLGVMPNSVSIVPTETGVTVSNVWADSTNIYCTVTNDKEYKWSAAVV